jgi:8-oxo-dGTP pyrophosphatase MutT (NUDIX family)
MAKERSSQSTANLKIPTLDQVSSGGVAFRKSKSELEVVIVSVLPHERWQLPKGIVDKGETPEMTAVREVREEAGIETELLAQIDTIEYWYIGGRGEKRLRYHKFVHFFLLAYRSGDVSNHDNEVAEARWVSIDEAISMLAFKSERAVVEKAHEMIVASQKAVQESRQPPHTDALKREIDEGQGNSVTNDRDV